MRTVISEPEPLPVKLEEDPPVVFYERFVKPVMSAEKVKHLLHIVWNEAYSKGFADRSRLDDRIDES